MTSLQLFLKNLRDYELDLYDLVKFFVQVQPIILDGLETNVCPSFKENKKIKFAWLSDKIEILKDYTFSNCVCLKNIILPKEVKNIGYGVFYNCLKLKNIVIPATVVRLRRFAFSGCRSLKSVTLLGSTSIGDDSFKNCTSLANITLSHCITDIGNWVFHGCFLLESITLPASLELLGLSPFYACTCLREIRTSPKFKERLERAYPHLKIVVYE